MNYVQMLAGESDKFKDAINRKVKQIFVVALFSGYDTTAQTLSYAGYELCKNPEVQKQLQEEVDLAYEEANGKTPDYGVIQVSNTFTNHTATASTLLLFISITHYKRRKIIKLTLTGLQT